MKRLIILLPFFLLFGCFSKKAVWQYDLGRSLKVQTIPLYIKEQKLIVTWRIDIVKSDKAKGRYVIPKVKDFFPGIHMKLVKELFLAKLVALDVSTGKERWKSEVLGESDQNLSSPVYYDGMIYVGSDNGILYEISSETGKTNAKIVADSWIYTTPAVSKKYIVFSTEKGTLYLVDRIRKNIIFRKKQGLTYFRWHILNDGIVGVIKNRVLKIDFNGKIIKEYTLSDKYIDYSGLERRGAPIGSELTVDKGYAYFISMSNRVYKFDLSGFAVEKSVYMDDITFAKPFIYDNLLFVGTNSGIAKLDKKTLKLLSKTKTTHLWMDFSLHYKKGGAVNGGFVEDNGILYFGSYDYTLYGYDLKKDKIVWKFSIKHHIDRTAPVITDKFVIFGADSHHIYAVEK